MKKPEKVELDRQTSYFTLLPAMDEGFHIGYQTRAGIVSDANRKPHEWLESVARSILTPGADVGYSIPDALAGEQQLRRLMRLPHADAMRHQEMIDWRAVLALLLLWDVWTKDGAWPELGFADALAAADGAFPRTVASALSPERAAEGLPLFTLSGERDHVPDKRPLCLLSRATIITPAADMGDLTALLPACVTWYDRVEKRFLDPCDFLDEACRARVTQGLRLLQLLNEQSALSSPLYSPEAPVCSVIDRFLSDLARPRESWRARLEAGDEAAARELQLRALAVYGLWERRASPGFTCERRALPAEGLRLNPLIERVLPVATPLPAAIESVTQTEYRIDGQSFARATDAYLLEPTLAPGEGAALERVRQELSLPSAYSAEWSHRVGERLLALAEERAGRAGASARVTALLRLWGRERAAARDAGEREVTLYYPIDGAPTTLEPLMDELLGLPRGEPVAEAFSDQLLLLEGACPFTDARLGESCRVNDQLFAVPPLSPWLARWLADAGEAADEETWPRLTALSFASEGSGVRARFRLERRRRSADALLLGAVNFERVYPENELFRVPADAAPTVAVWPNARLGGLWRAYYVHVHRPDAVDVWVESGGAWTQGAFRRAKDPGGSERRWQTVRTEQFPAYVALKRGGVSLGALPNDRPRERLKREPAAIIGLDFGSIATTVMLRQEDRVRPATLPGGLLSLLTVGRAEDATYLADELLPENLLAEEGPRPSTFRSVMDLFTDDERAWREILCDGHIYYPSDWRALLSKDERALYTDLKWSEEGYALACLRLFLKQAMAQAALSARLYGSPSVSWRVSMPNALPLPRQEAYLALMRALAREVSELTGLPLSEGVPPVLYATENQADGLYFRSRNEVNARGGYLNLDVGGGTSDLSLWLGNATSAALESSLRLGCREMLYDSLSERHPGELRADFADAPDDVCAAVDELTRAFADSGRARGRQRNRMLLDAFVAERSADVAAMAGRARAAGQVSLLESALLLHFSFLFRLCGLMLDRAADDENARALLGARIELCVAGNGGQFLKDFDEEARRKLCRLALGALRAEHPVREMVLRQSMNPKQEVAIGLLCEEQRLRSTVEGEVVRDEAEPPAPDKTFLPAFLTAFCAAFPQAAERLLGHVFEQEASRVRLKPAAEIELAAVLDNELADASDEPFAAQTRCFAAMKRLWGV